MLIATYNANSIRPRLPLILSWLAKHSPDVLALQETKVPDEDFPALAFENAGYHCAFKGQKSYNGVAILSKHPLSDVSFGFGDGDPADHARILKASSGTITVVNTYVPQGFLPDSEKFRQKLAWFKRLRTWFENNFSPSDPIVWLGYLNVAPEPIDVHDPQRLSAHVCFHPAARAALKEVVDWGFVDCFRLHHKDEPNQYTFWDYRYPKWIKRDVGWRIDHIFATKPLAKKCTDSFIDRSARLETLPSDHTFLAAEFRV